MTPYLKRFLKIYLLLLVFITSIVGAHITLHRDRIFPDETSVVLYGRDSCGITTAMREYLDRQGVPYTYGNVDRLFVTQEMVHHLDKRTGDDSPQYTYFPVVIVAGRVLERPRGDEVLAIYREATEPAMRPHGT